MGKKRSAILITLLTLVIVALCFISTVSFSYGPNGMYQFNSLLRTTTKDADVGGAYGASGYKGGGYSVTYYPEGVITAKDYQDSLELKTGDARDEYADSYVPYLGGTLYLDKEDVCGGGDEPTEEFKQSFENTLKILEARYAHLRVDGTELSVTDDYTVRVFLPEMMDAKGVAFTVNAYTGEFSVRYGSSADSADEILPALRKKTINDYFDKAYTRTGADGTVYIALQFTAEGRDVLAEETQNANTMYFMVGDNQVIPLTISEAVDSKTLYISGSYTAETASIYANVINTVMKADDPADTLKLTVSDTLVYKALYGGNTLTALYIAFGVCFVAMMVFFFVRYRRLGFVHLYTYLIFTLIMIVCVYAIPFLYLSVETFIAFLFLSLLLSVCNAVTFEYARKEYALGKTMASSVKEGYKKCFWHIFDLHIVIAVLSFIMFGIGLTNLHMVAFILGLGTVFSGLACLGLNRLTWAAMMSFTTNKGGFCNFQREVVDDDD